MAVWQFKFKPIPSLPQAATPDQLWESWGWSERPLPDSFVNDIRLLLPHHATYGALGNESCHYGNPSQDDIQFCFEAHRVVEVGIRLDLRALNQPLLEDVLKLVVSIDGLLVSSESDIFAPTWEDAMAVIKISPAARFVRNPLAFLESVPFEN